MSQKVAVMIPCYNEEMTIEKVIKGWKQELPEADIYVYDNNSSDRTKKVAEQVGAQVRNVYEKGKGNVVRQMFIDNDADCLIMVDGDNTYSETEGRAMVSSITEKGYDMVIGDRLTFDYFNENKKVSHAVGNVIVNKIIRVLYKENIKDTLSGCRAFSYNFTKKNSIDCSGFEVEAEITIKAISGKWKIASIPIKYSDREKGSRSKISTYMDGPKILAKIFKMYFTRGVE